MEGSQANIPSVKQSVDLTGQSFRDQVSVKLRPAHAGRIPQRAADRELKSQSFVVLPPCNIVKSNFSQIDRTASTDMRGWMKPTPLQFIETVKSLRSFLSVYVFSALPFAQVSSHNDLEQHCNKKVEVCHQKQFNPWTTINQSFDNFT